MSDNLRGMFLMVVAMAAFTGNDTLMKSVTVEVPLFQAIALRGGLTLVMIWGVSHVMGGLRLRVTGPDTRRLVLRNIGEVGATLFFLSALQHMPLANLSAIMQSLPLVVTVLAALMFGERLGWRRFVAIAIGFVGVLLIVKPGAEGFDGWAVIGLVAMGCVALRDMATRGLSRDVPSLTVTFHAALSVTVLGVLVAPFQGVSPVSLSQLVLLAGAACFLIAGYFFIVMATRVGDVSLIAPFRYSSLLWAILLGWITFGQLPDGLTLLGGALVVSSGLFTLYRQGVKARLAQPDKADQC